MSVLHPEIVVVLSEQDAVDDNVLFDRVCTALRQARLSPDEVQAFIDEAVADFDNLLTTAESWVTVN